MKRTFELLTRPLFDDESYETGATVDWPGARDFRVIVDHEVASYFEIEHSFEPPWFSVRVRRVGPCDELVRFAAMVECDTDDDTPQSNLPARSSWPSLKSSKTIDPPFRNNHRGAGGTSAWEQLDGQRHDLLAPFDAAKRKGKGHIVRVHHGRVAEGVFRKWLGSFLPKRYGVTSGFIVSQGQRGDAVFPHYDVIIYDQLSAPVLWVDANPDASDAGTSRAIPAPYVRCVMEVKSSFDATNARDAMEHLKELAPYYAGIDSPAQRYRQYLPRDFSCAVVFFDATAIAQRSSAALAHLAPVDPPRGFYGGIILRGEGQPEDASGHIRMFARDGVAEPLLMWMPIGFSTFAFDLVALLEGTYDPGYASSFFSAYVPNT